MDEVLKYLKDNPTYYLATVDAQGNPDVRPFGTISKIDGDLYIQTGMVKDCYKQMEAHPQIAICTADDKGTWLRLTATVVPVLDDAIVNAVLDEYPQLRDMYTPGDGNTVVLKLTNATARFCSFTAEPRTVTF